MVFSTKHPGIYSGGACLQSSSFLRLSCQLVRRRKQAWIKGLATGSSFISRPATYDNKNQTKVLDLS